MVFYLIFCCPHNPKKKTILFNRNKTNTNKPIERKLTFDNENAARNKSTRNLESDKKLEDDKFSRKVTTNYNNLSKRQTNIEFVIDEGFEEESDDDNASSFMTDSISQSAASAYKSLSPRSAKTREKRRRKKTIIRKSNSIS